jgi:hypothetical protein
MAHDETPMMRMPGTAIAVVRPATAAKPSLARTAINPDFISQMLAARDRLPAQRRRRQAPLEEALGAYAEGRDRGRPRLPPGFFSTRLI